MAELEDPGWTVSRNFARRSLQHSSVEKKRGRGGGGVTRAIVFSFVHHLANQDLSMSAIHKETNSLL